MEPVISVLPHSTHVAEWLPRDTDIAVPDGEYLPGRHFAQAVANAYPTRKVFAIEKFGSGISAARTQSQRTNQRYEKKSDIHSLSSI